MKCPCTQDCKSRNTYCHVNCTAYKFYELAKRKEYKERAKRQAVNEYYFEQMRRRKVASSIWY